MKSLLFIGIIALFVSGLKSSGERTRPQQSVRFQPQTSYVYQYSARLMSGIPLLSQQFSGLELKSQVVFQSLSDSLIAMKMNGIRIGKHNGQVDPAFPAGPSPVMDHQTHAQLQQELSKPIRFVYSEGKVKAFESDQSEPEWSLNMKKALLSLLNLDLQPKKIIRSAVNQKNNQIIQNNLQDLTVYPIYEEGIGGLCETVYELQNSLDPQSYNSIEEESFVLNVTKTRNYGNCLTEPIIVNDNYDVRGCPWVCRKEKSFSAVAGYYPVPDAVQDPYMSGCPCGKEPNESPVDSYAFQKYNISLIGGVPLIEGVYAEGKTSYMDNSDEILVITQQNLTLNQQLLNQQISSNAFQIQRPIRHNELSFRLPKPTQVGQSSVQQNQLLDIPYYYLFGPIDQQELQNLIPELLESLANQIASEEIATPSAEKIGQNVIQLVNALAVLQQHQLEQLFEQVAKEGVSITATPQQQVMRKLFLDALPLSGSNDAALAIKDLILEQKVTESESKELVEGVPQNLFLADLETIDAYLELYQSPKVQSRRHLAASTGIAFGKMVKEVCVKRQSTPGDIPDDNTVPHNKRNLPAQMVVQGATPSNNRITVQSQRTTSSFSQRMRRSADWEEQFTQQVCSSSDVTKYVTIVARLLEESNQFHQKVTLIETLAHMGVPHVLPVLEPYISGSAQQSGQCPGYPTETEDEQSEECNFIRQVAIYALSHVAENYPKQVAPLVAPVYSDVSEPYEVRIAAFTTLIFSSPEKQVLERIASQLYQENNKQIKSFVYSTLQTVANITAPCFQHVAQHAQQAVQHAPQINYGYQYSKMIGNGFFDQNKDFGLYSLMEWTNSNNSRVPRAVYWNIGQSAGPFQDDLLEIGFQAKGLDPIVERVFGQNGVFEDAFTGMRAKTRDRRVNKRSADSAQQLLEALKSKLDLTTRGEEQPKLTLFFKLFDRTSYYALDKHYIHQVIDSAEDSLKDIAQTLMQGQQYHYVKLVMPSQLYKVVPSELGLPIVITHRHPLILSVKVDQAKLQVEVSPKTVVPIGGNITAQITPSIFYSSHTFAFAVNPADRQAYGAHVQKTTHAQLPVEVSIGYSRPKSLITWSVIPKTNGESGGQNQEIYYQKTKSDTFIAKAAVSGAPDSDWLQDSQEVKTMATPFQYEQVIGQQELGIGVRVQVQSESAWSEEPIRSGETYEKFGTIPAFVQSWRNPGLKAREVHVQLEQDSEEPVQGYDFTLRYKWVEDSEQQSDKDDSDESSASDESDSDQSDESSESQSSESNSSESNSDSNENKSSRSSQSSEESNESGSANVKQRIQRRMNKVINNNNREKRSVNQNKRREESNESSDESSNESGSQSNSKSGSRESSQSSSSESDSSEEKKKNKHDKYNSKSAKSSESESSSSESDSSQSFEDQVFQYEDVMKLILGQEFSQKSIKKITKQLIQKTQKVWEENWDEDYDQSSSDESNELESQLTPQTISHDFVFTAVARGPRPTYYALNLLYVHTYDHRIVWVKSDGYVKAPRGVYLTVPTLYCADAVVSYPTIPNEFYFEPQMSSQKARIQAQMGWGQQCQTEGGVIVKGVLEQTQDHVLQDSDFANNGQSGAQTQNWYYAQCNEDRERGHAQSYACERAIEASSFFNQLILDVKYEGIPKHVQNLTRKSALALKAYYYQYLDDNEIDVTNPENQLRIVAQYSQRVSDLPLVNLEIRSPNEIQQFQRMHVPRVRPISSLYSVSRVNYNLDTDYEGANPNPIPFWGSNPYSTCYLMEQNFIRTYDNVTYQLPRDSYCQFLLSKDVSAKERFALFAQQLEPEVGTKTLTLLISGVEIKLLPPQQQNVAQVLVDGHAHELTYRQPLTLIGSQLRVYLRATPSEANNPIVVLESDSNQLQVLYDGKNAKIQLVGGQYQGKTLGLCGDNNDEPESEFLGPDLCRYEDEEDFALSYALSGQHCEQKPQPRGQRQCPSAQSQNNQNQNQVNQVVEQKQVTHAQNINGQTTLVRQEISQPDNQIRANQIQTQANEEELARAQQQMSDRQMARQNGEPVTRGQQETLYGGSRQQQQLIQRLRTQYIERDDMICFTTKPQLTCVQGVSRASAVRDVKADFHCLPKSSEFTRQLIQESLNYVVLKQLANKRVDLRQVIQVPVTCLSIV